VKAFVLVLVLVAAPVTSAAQRCTPFDTLFYNGHILTGQALLSANPQRVSALGISQGKVAATGADADLLPCGATVKVDLHGAFVMPGFNDAHTHMAYAGQQRLTVDLDNVPSLAAMQAKVKAYAAGLSDGQWILGGGWDHTKWASRTLPTRQDLDAVSNGHPLFLTRTDGHIGIANTAALAAAGITDETPDPRGGKIDRDADGHATGILREDSARALVERKVPPPSYETRRKALQLSIDDALAHGVTSVQDFSDWDDWLVLEGMEREGKLPLRVSEWLAFDQPLGVLKSRRASHDPNDPLLHLGMLKAFMDGSLGSRTAALAEPYADDPANSGIPVTTSRSSTRCPPSAPPQASSSASTPSAMRPTPSRSTPSPRPSRQASPPTSRRCHSIRTRTSSPPPSGRPCLATSASASSTRRCCCRQTSTASTSSASSPPCSPATCSRTWPGPAPASAPTA
jgi:predicted amidohydrolase YtcJ